MCSHSKIRFVCLFVEIGLISSRKRRGKSLSSYQLIESIELEPVSIGACALLDTLTACEKINQDASPSNGNQLKFRPMKRPGAQVSSHGISRIECNVTATNWCHCVSSRWSPTCRIDDSQVKIGRGKTVVSLWIYYKINPNANETQSVNVVWT